MEPNQKKGKLEITNALPQKEAAVKPLLIETSDNHEVFIDQPLAFLSSTIKNLYEDCLCQNTESVLRLEQINNGKILEKIKELLPSVSVIRGTKKTTAVTTLNDSIKDLSVEFLIDLLKASFYLDLKELTDPILVKIEEYFFAAKDLNKVITLFTFIDNADIKNELKKRLINKTGSSLFLIFKSTIHRLPVEQTSSHADFLLDGMLALNGRQVWDPIKCQLLKEVNVEEIVDAIDISYREGGEWRCWSMISPDRKYLLIDVEELNKSILWNLGAGELVKVLDRGDYSGCCSLIVTHDEKYALTTHDREVIQWHLKQENKEIAPCKLLEQTFFYDPIDSTSLAITQDDNFTLTASNSGKTAHLFNLKTGEIAKNLIGHKEPIISVAVSADGKYALTASEETVIVVWDLTQEGKELYPYKVLSGNDHPVTLLALSCDANLAATGSEKQLLVWDLSGTEPKLIANYNWFRTRILAVSFTNDKKHLLVALDNNQVFKFSWLEEIQRLTFEQLIVIVKLDQCKLNGKPLSGVLLNAGCNKIFNSIPEDIKESVKKHFALK